ncbi:snoRNP assembly factor Naf1 [Drechmeria coniospora]|uniref:H/ACA ribonucleoprotein complex non-core subunit NAF1 n=1 Tax=Drechmeria coniospora TaxID=98403 RepID=A0A151GQ23_DRECN|nr:snoRNP assembly factor Naf1 [Drechmeria coniospora]KYK59161.1 snoRNP assembly factor Naf1 [Drechmeria coniospora]
MSGFQIPGLGQAKPNERLPPLAADEQMQDANPPTPDLPPPNPVSAEPTTARVIVGTGDGLESTEGEKATEDAVTTEDAMLVDGTDSTPSLTHALEAAIGGLDEATTTAAPAQEQEATEPTASTELQADVGENPEWEIDSSPYESSSDSSSSDSSDSDSDNEGYEPLGIEETVRLLMQSEGGSDDEGDKAGRSATATQLRTKNEILDEVIPKPDVSITAEMKIEELGVVEFVVENTMLVKAFTPGEYQVLDTGSVLCTAERTVIGAVAETIGKVLQPMYTVRFNTEDEIKELGIEIGTKVFYPPDHASFVFTEPLKNLKGSDASNIHDEEVGDDDMEFSDDEKEAEHKRSLKQKRNRNKAPADGGTRGARGPHPLRQEAVPDGDLNYDDDGPYKPLARPPGYGIGGASGDSIELPPRSGSQRGGRRGDRGDRGNRGGRGGRGSRGRGDLRGGARGGHGQPRDGYSLPPQGYQQQYPPQPQHQPAGGNSWANPSGPSPPAMPNFGFQFPGWPQQGQGMPVPPPPPPPMWPAQGGQAQGQQSGGTFMDPALLAALMSQMQAQSGQRPWGGQPPPSS